MTIRFVDKAAVASNDIAAIRTRFGDHAGVLAETVLLRRRAQTKLAGLAGLSHWLFTDEALQQATAVQVAHATAPGGWRGAYCMTPPVRWETELAACGRPPRMWSAATSTKSGCGAAQSTWASGGADGGGADDVSGGSIAVPCGRAEVRQPRPVVVLDPARRSGGNRGSIRAGCILPPTDHLIEDWPTTGAGPRVVLKCAPGIGLEAVRRLEFHEAETEITSYRGSVREALPVGPPRASLIRGVRRRATVLSRGRGSSPSVIPTDAALARPSRWTRRPGRCGGFRAGLVRHYGSVTGRKVAGPQHRLSHRRQSPTGVGFEVLDELPMRRKGFAPDAFAPQLRVSRPGPRRRHRSRRPSPTPSPNRPDTVDGGDHPRWGGCGVGRGVRLSILRST